MREPDPPEDVLLYPGDVYFGGGNTRVRTLLGSCVAVTLWHPEALVGGMCHYMMPTRPGGAGRRERSGRYADEAFDMLLDGVRLVGVPAREFQVKLFGGGRQFADHPPRAIDVAAQNADAGLHLLQRHGLTATSMHLRGKGHRQVILELWTGDVWLRHADAMEASFS